MAIVGVQIAGGRLRIARAVHFATGAREVDVDVGGIREGLGVAVAQVFVVVVARADEGDDLVTVVVDRNLGQARLRPGFADFAQIVAVHLPQQDGLQWVGDVHGVIGAAGGGVLQDVGAAAAPLAEDQHHLVAVG